MSRATPDLTQGFTGVSLPKTGPRQMGTDADGRTSVITLLNMVTESMVSLHDNETNVRPDYLPVNGIWCYTAPDGTKTVYQYDGTHDVVLWKLDTNGTATTTNVPTFLIGSVFAHTASDTYVPNGCVCADAAEYTESQFPTFYTDYLAAGKLVTCTYAEFAAQVAATGNCAKFALDQDNHKFRVPLQKDGDSITAAVSASEIGKSVKAGLPDVQWVIDQIDGSTVLTASGAVKSTRNHAETNSLYGGGSVGSRYTLDGKASRQNPIYGNSTSVTDEQVRLRHFVVLASAQNNASMFDWSAYMAALAGKANKDLSNLSPEASEIIRGAITLRNISTRSTIGTWTLTGIKVGRPLWLVYRPTNNESNSHCTAKVTSGAELGQAAYNDTFHMGRGTAWGSSNNILIKPTSTEVVISVYSIFGTGTLYAEQI